MKPDSRLNLLRKLSLIAACLGLIGTVSAAPPTISGSGTIAGGDEDTATNITYEELDNIFNINDPDGTPVGFRIEAVSSGSLSVPVNTVINSGQSVDWTPAANANGTLNAFTVKAFSGGEASVSTVQVRVQIDAVDDTPDLSGSVLSSINDNIGETSSAGLFLQNLNISDVESDDVTVVVTIPQSAEDFGDITMTGATRSTQSNNYVYTFPSASLATANSRLDAARYAPVNNALTAGTTQTFNVSVLVRQTAAPSLSDSVSQNLGIVSIDDPPQVNLTLVPATISAGVEAQPFRVTVNDPDLNDNNTKTVTLTLTPSNAALGTLTLPPSGLTGLKAAVEAAMMNVSYRPNAVTSGTTVDFTCAVQGTSSQSSRTLTITFVNSPPDISGISSELIRTDDDAVTPPVVPFSGVVISDANVGQLLSATVTPDNPAKGTVTPPVDGLTNVTAPVLTQRLRQVTYKPASNRVTVGQTETTTLTLSVTDGVVSASNDLTRVASLSVNGAPSVALPPVVTQPLKIAGETSGKPFALVTVSDDDAVPNVTVTLKIDDAAKGTLTNLGNFAPLAGSPGTWVFTGDPAEANQFLHDIDYTLNPDYSFPAGQPGATTFTIEAKDALQNRSTLVMSIVMENAARNFLVTSRQDPYVVPVPPAVLPVLLPGTLRHAIQNAKENDVITFALAEYPAVVRLNPGMGPITCTKHLRIKGPGADLLTISGDGDGNGTPDTQLFEVQATVAIEGLTLSKGTAQTGGAAHVSRNPSSPANPAGSLTLSYCAVTDCTASQWGGAIDVEEGSLAMDHCLVMGNATDAGAGLGGGAISLYTSQPCSFSATTFSGNRQRATTGYGGGAIYAENFNPQVVFPVAVTHCTFSENQDAAVRGTSIHSNVFNCRVTTRGSIFADAAQRNLHVAGSGQIISAGRNISNDAARTVLIQSGQPQSILLLNQPDPGGDKVSTNPQLLPLAPAIAGLSCYGLSPLSPAIGTTTAVEGTDQRGVMRDTMPDSGAVEYSRTERVIIHEIQPRLFGSISAFAAAAPPALGTRVTTSGPHGLVTGDTVSISGSIEAAYNGNFSVTYIDPNAFAIPVTFVSNGEPRGTWLKPDSSFVELYIPRDSAPVNFAGMTVWANGKLRHTFTSHVSQPGSGVILSETDISSSTAGTPVVLPDDELWDISSDSLRGALELRRSDGSPAARVDFVNFFLNPLTLTRDFENNSITLAPQFRGSAYVPNSAGMPPPLGPLLTHNGPISSPGSDTGGTPFGQPNARPFAAADSFIVNEDDLVTVPVLSNDIDSDGLDKLVIVDVSRLRSAPVGNPPVGDDAAATSFLQSGLSIAPAAAPLRGAELWYDPRTAQNHLPVGVFAQDTFFYTIVDIGTGPIAEYAQNGAVTNITSPAHRLINNEQITISGAGNAGYNGTFAITKIDENTFSIPVTFTTNPAVKGAWQTAGTRQPTARSENQVTLTVFGRNDAPTPAGDTVATNEEQILRIMGDPDLIPLAPVFDTDPSYPLPRAFSTVSLLANDTDPDDDDNTFRKLRIVGVTQAKAVAEYAGSPGVSPVTVTIAGHGLTTGDTVLISGYGGHSSYNNSHVATVVDADKFTIPIAFVDNHAQKGLAGVLTAEGRLSTISALGAAVTLEIRNSRLETNIIYNPRTSATLNALSINEPTTDSFYYVVEDSHGANALSKISVNVTGVNDDPEPQNDPGSLNGLSGLVTGGATLRDALAAARVQYSIPSAIANRGTVTLTAGGTTYVLTGVPRTNEDAALNIPATEILGNDSDVDHLDTLRVTLGAGQNVSREGAAVSLAGGGTTVVYNPAASARLNALSREEKIIDTIALNIFDNTAFVTAVVAIEVTGRNDKPTALADTATIPEDQLLTLAPPAVLINDRDPDQDTRVPDNRKVIIPASDVTTTVYGARISAAVTPAAGNVESFAAVSGNASLTQVNAPAHGLNTGEEIVISGTAVEAYNGQFPVTRVDDNSFTIPVPSAAGAATAGIGTWLSQRSTVAYDPRGSVFTSSPANTTFTLDGLAQGQTYTDAWTYTMFDGSMVFANDDTFRVEADAANVVLEVSANDVNLTGVTGALTIVAVGTPSERGSVDIGDGNTIIYTPETSFAGDEFFTYTVQDAQGNADTALVTVRVTIEQLNGNLQANRDAFTVAKGQSPLLNVLANDDIVPPSSAAISITAITTAPNAGGAAVIEGTGIRYTPGGVHAVYPYSESFTYEISGGGTARAIAVVSINVANRENTLPLRADVVSVQAGSSNNVLNVLANDNILPGSGLDLIITASTVPSNGTVTITPDRKRLIFTPDTGFIGTSTFTYTAGDGLGGTGTANVSVVVGGLTTNNDFFTVASTTATPVTLDVLANDRVLGSPGTVTIKAMAPVVTPIGTLSVTAGALTLTFTPVTGQTGERTFTYTIQDGTGREAAGSLTVFVSGPGLLANSDFFTVQADSQGSELNVLLNDVQIPDLGLPRTISGIGTGTDAPDHGGTAEILPPTVSIPYERIFYTPAAGFIGEERFTYSVTNGDVTAVTQVVVRVTNGTLFASDDAFSVFKGSSTMRLEVLANDKVLPFGGQTLTITGIGIVQNAPGQQGAVVVAEDGGALVYTPNAANTVYPYTESFTYEISDGTAARAQATVRVEVLDRIGAREMETNDDAFTVLADGQNIPLAVLANDDIRPASAIGWTITDTGTPSQGGSAIVSGPAISYTPRAGFVGTETFVYTVSDGLGGTGTATVTVKVGDISVSDDVFTVLSGSGDTNLDVLVNDGMLPDGFPDRPGLPGLTGFTLAPAPAIVPSQGGTAAVSNGHIVYRPAANFVGEETFTYLVKDDSGVTFPGKVTVNVEASGSDRSSAVLSVTVTGVNDAPVFVNPAATSTDDRTSIRPFANASVLDVDDQQRQRVTLRVTWPAGQGTLSGGFTVISPGVIEFSGRPSEVTSALRGLVFTPVNNRIPVGTTEQTAFAVTLNDGFVSSPVAVSGNTTTVTPVNDRPVLTGTVGSQMLYKGFTLQPFIGTNITDVDNLGAQTLQVAVQIDNAIKGRLTGGFTEQTAGSGIYTFTGTPAAAAAALRGLVFEPTPGGRITPSQSETSTFTITVNDTFSAPVVDSVTTVIVVHGEQDLILPLTPGGQDASQNGAEFSSSVALSGDTLVVGSPRRDGAGVDTGTVHVYERNAGVGLPWGQVAVLQPNDLSAGDFFGYSAAIDGDLLVIGAPFADPAGLPGNTGAAYVFRRNPADRNAWIQVLKLTPPVAGTGSNDNFGTSVAVDGTTVLVGSPKTTLGGEPGVGRVHIYERNQGGTDNFGIAQTVVAGDGRNGHNFGSSLAMDGNTAIIGAAGASRSFAAADLELGAAYIFNRPAAGGTWTETRKLSAFADPESRVNDHFGYSVDIDGDTIIVGAAHFDVIVGGTRRTDSGAAFIYDRNNGGADAWNLTTKIPSPNAQDKEHYGTSVAIAGDLALVGCPKENNSASSNGFVDLRRRNLTGANTWGLVDRFVDGPEPVLDRFGQSVALDVFTGAAGSTVDAVNAGSARVYQFLFEQGPRLAFPIADQSAPENQVFNFQVPATAFGDANFGSALTYTALLSDGTPLPAGGWLSFNAATRTFTGTPVPANNRDYRLIVRAVNQLGSVATSNAFSITVPLDPARAVQRLYGVWAAGKFPAATLANSALEGTVWGMMANPDDDSARNLVEMVFNTNPQVRELSPLVVVKNADATVSVTFPRNAAVPLEFIHVEWSDSMATWGRSGVGYTTFIGTDSREYVTATIYPDAVRRAIYIRLAVGL